MQAKDIKGKNIALTGKFSEVKRAEAEAALARLGATIGSGITRTTDVLFAGERAGSKLAKAKSLGVTILDEAALVALLDQAPAAKAADTKPKPALKSTPVAGLAGKTVALTGTFTTMKRADAQKLLAEAGATVGSGVTKATEILIYGDNAGSKLDKAASAGVTLMTEAEMVALLTAGGAGKDQLAGAGEKLAQKQAQDAAAATEMTKVVAELRAFVQALKKRKDITVEHATLGRKAGKDKLSFLETVGVPDELLEFHALMDGIRVEWRSIEFSGEGGCIRMSPVTQHSRFTGDEVHYMGFGDDREAMLLDEITPEGNTWLVRAKANKRKQRGDCTIIFANAAEGADGIVLSSSISKYLRDAMRHSFAFYWPRSNE